MREHQRPQLQPASSFDAWAGSESPAVAHALAHETAWALLNRVRRVADPEVVDRVLRVAAGPGIDDLAELWSHASPLSLAGMLWRIAVLRRAVDADPTATAWVFSAGRDRLATIDPVVAGAADPLTPDAVGDLCDEILRGVFAGDLAGALDRASSYCRVMAHGAAAHADDHDELHDADARDLTRRALRYATLADELHAGAKRFRNGVLD